MKKRISILSIALLLWAMAVNAQGFILKGKVKGNVEGRPAMLQKYEIDKIVNLDSTTIHNGEFTLKGDVAMPTQYQMVIDLNPTGSEPDYQNMFISPIYIENKPMTYKVDLTGFPTDIDIRNLKPIIKGSDSQALCDQFINMNAPLEEKIGALNAKIEEAKDPTQLLSWAKESMNLENEYQEKQTQFIKENSNSIVALDLALAAFSTLPSSYTEKQIDEILGWFRTYWGDKPQFANLETQANLAKNTAVGKPFIDGTLLDVNGKEVKLSSLIKKGEYTMLEFWASWCHPCRQEIPHLKKVHEKYKDFNIISISVDERDADWKKAMSKEGMTWTQLRNPEGFGGLVMDKYGITAIPACIILDKEGKFYKSNMRGAYLDAFLYDYYKR